MRFTGFKIPGIGWFAGRMKRPEFLVHHIVTKDTKRILVSYLQY